MKKVVLLGKNGQLGQGFIKQFGLESTELYSFGSEDLDITDYASVKNTLDKLQPEFVVNTTAYTNVPDCENKIDKAFTVNAFSLKNLATECKKLKITLITFSTDYVFDGTKGSGYIENDMPNPLQIYGLSKYTGEILSALYCDNVYIIRTNGVFGGHKGSRAKGGNFVLNILKKAETTDHIEMVDDQIVSPTYAVDLAKSTVELINKKAPFGIYHLINEGSCSWAEFAAYILNKSGSETVINPVHAENNKNDFQRPLYSVLQNTKARELGITLPAWQDAVQRYLKYLKNI